MQFRKGFLILKLPNGIPLLIHWTVLAMVFLYGGFSFQPAIWLALFIIILVHEIGHAIAVWNARASVTAIYMDGMGGHCAWTGNVTQRQRLAIVWGGVIAQLILWGITAVTSLFIHPPINAFILQLFKTLLGWNLFLVALNLLPVAPLDGHQAWSLLWSVWQGRHQPSPERQRLSFTEFEMKAPVQKVVPKSEIQEVISRVLERAAAEHRAKKQVAETKKDQN